MLLEKTSVEALSKRPELKELITKLNFPKAINKKKVKEWLGTLTLD